MAATIVEIVNMALTRLGEGHIVSMSDNTKPAREANTIYQTTKDALLGGYNWSFAKTRAILTATLTAPAFEYALAYDLPADCLRVLFVGEYYVGLDLTDYRGAPTELFVIEGRQILTDMGTITAPSTDNKMNLKYVKKEDDVTKFSINFTSALIAKLAENLAEPLTQSDSKRARAEAAYKDEIKIAIRANAIELPPQKLADDEWLLARL
ncbi:MAG: hypothetical protein ACYC5T_10000 [Thiobacillus sp.]